MKIYTKTGDGGETALFGGQRVSKSCERIEAYGTLDELNAHVGFLMDLGLENENVKQQLFSIQNTLFVLGAQLATTNEPKRNIEAVSSKEIEELERAIDEMEKKLNPLKNFILPSGHKIVSFCHICRTICRRAERKTVLLASQEKINESIIPYLNRLSDYFFVLARFITKELNVKEKIWQAPKR